MTDQAAASPVPTPAQDEAHGHCENCDAVLHGHYCHDCGQSTHSPVRHVGHAIEEVFESFWHLDGRVFRTLRDLMVPGRAAIEYLAGHRARYIPPLRMFVILSVLTFFIGKLTVHFEIGTPDVNGGTDIAAITAATTEEAVRREEKRLLADIAEGRREIAENAPIPGLDAVMISEEIRIRGEADNRIAQLRRAGAAPEGGPVAADGAPAPTDPAPDKPTERADVADAGPDASTDPEWEGPLFTTDSEAWDPDKNPVRIGWLPDFANTWLSNGLANANANMERMQRHPDLWVQALMSSLPSALFVLVPLFALLLKVAYLFKRRLYLEHLVVALYSHCFMLVGLAVMFLMVGLGDAAGASLPWLDSATDIIWMLILTWMPFYLLIMQKRVYGQGWPMTLVKYLVVGTIYFWMLTLTATLMFLATMAKPV